MTLLSAGSGADPRTGALLARAREVFISGAALTIPALVTVIILVVVVDFVLGIISPATTLITDSLGVGQNVAMVYQEVLGVLVLVALIFAVGVVAETRSGDSLERVFDTAMARIPGVGSVYTSFNEMTELLLSNDTQSFQEVKLVEFPVEGSYTLAFVTADTPEDIQGSTGHDGMTTLFMPMAPNPVMGGFVVHVADERVRDIDLTVEEGIRSIVTSGVATGDGPDDRHEGELVDLEAIRSQARGSVDDFRAWQANRVDDFGDVTDLSREEIAALARQRAETLRPEDDGDADPVHYMLDREGPSAASADGDGAGGSADSGPDADAADGDAPEAGNSAEPVGEQGQRTDDGDSES